MSSEEGQRVGRSNLPSGENPPAPKDRRPDPPSSLLSGLSSNVVTCAEHVAAIWEAKPWVVLPEGGASKLTNALRRLCLVVHACKKAEDQLMADVLLPGRLYCRAAEQRLVMDVTATHVMYERVFYTQEDDMCVESDPTSNQFQITRKKWRQWAAKAV